MSRTKITFIVALIVVAVFSVGRLWFTQPSFAGTIFTGTTPGVAINGYDPVGYFKQDQAVKGSADHAYDWQGTTWHFASGANRDAFADDPERYAPQYGGYCAFAAAKNSLAKTEPDAFTVYDGKLYLNYDQPIKDRWDGQRDTFIESASENWPGLQEQARAR